jgi:hypothetical protein
MTVVQPQIVRMLGDDIPDETGNSGLVPRWRFLAHAGGRQHGRSRICLKTRTIGDASEFVALASS